MSSGFSCFLPGQMGSKDRPDPFYRNGGGTGVEGGQVRSKTDSEPLRLGPVVTGGRFYHQQRRKTFPTQTLRTVKGPSQKCNVPRRRFTITIVKHGLTLDLVQRRFGGTSPVAQRCEDEDNVKKCTRWAWHVLQIGLGHSCTCISTEVRRFHHFS